MTDGNEEACSGGLRNGTKREYSEGMSDSGFVELCAISNFTFLTGAAHPEEMMQQAARLGLQALAVADLNSVAGIVRAHAAAREIRREAEERRDTEEIGPPAPEGLSEGWQMTCPRLIPAATLVFEEGLMLTALPATRQGWAHLSRLLSIGRLRVSKGQCLLRLDDLFEHSAGMYFVLHPPGHSLWGKKR